MNFKLITDLKKLEGTMYYEFLAGPYQDKCWSAGSGFLVWDVFEIVEPIFSKRMACFDFQGRSQASAIEIANICSDLDLAACCESFAQLKQLLKLNEGEWSSDQISELRVLAKDLSSWLGEKVKQSGVITIIGL